MDDHHRQQADMKAAALRRQPGDELRERGEADHRLSFADRLSAVCRMSRWKHRKRGTAYDVLTSTAAAQCATGPINEGDYVTVYQGDDGNWWVRRTDEFQDGRFERIL